MTEAELPAAVADSIASWCNVMRNARPDIASDILLNAAADLFRTRRIARTVSPNEYGIVTQAIADALHDMAQAAGIDDDAAQTIFALARDKPEQTNGHALIEASATNPDDYGADPAPAEPIASASFITPAAWPNEAPPPVDWLAAGRIPRGEVTLFAGDGGAGKTDAALQLAANVARRAPDWFGHEIAAGAGRVRQRRRARARDTAPLVLARQARRLRQRRPEQSAPMVSRQERRLRDGNSRSPTASCGRRR